VNTALAVCICVALHGGPSDAEKMSLALWSGILVFGGLAVAALIYALKLVAARSAERRSPCPGCGRFIDTEIGSACPFCGQAGNPTGKGKD
jgi:hypothetical protein